MELYDHEEAETSTLYNMLLTNLELYNRKLLTLERTRDVIEGMTGAEDFNKWDGMYMARKVLKLECSHTTCFI